MNRSVWIAFAVLCILSATSWVIPHGEELPVIEQQGVRYAVIGVFALLLGGSKGWSWREGLHLGLMSVGFFGVPVAVVEWTQGSVSEISRSALFAMVPVVVVMVIAAGDEERGVRRFLIPALAGLGGLLLLLPMGFSGTLLGRLMLGAVCAAVVLVGLSSVWLYRLLRGVDLMQAVAAVCLVNAAFLLVCSVVSRDAVWRVSELASVISIGSLVDVVEVVLIVWLLREMPPVRFAARCLLIPLLTILESYVLVRPEVTVRLACGTILLAAGAGMLLFLNSGDEETMLSLR
ncbi:EamA family transporter [Tunturiibacter lichenicola]|uniref:EamA family transporter n=1 Tax=Tunturiibacter lichenicola TaxID=2051959 RepID=UPI003D9B5D9A